MLRFFVRRVLFGALVVWIISVVAFVLFFTAPHNVARLLAGAKANPHTVEIVRERLGLNEPIIEQYGDFLWRLLHGNLGYSFYTDQPVTDKLLDALPVTLSLVGGAAVIWLLIGIGTGVIAATKPRTLADRATTLFALFFYSMPTFLLGLIFLYLLFYRLDLAGVGIFEGAGSYVPLGEGPLQWAHSLILPWFTLALVLAATYARLTRGSLLDVLGEDYIRTARSKGITERRVTFRHGLRSALTPVVTQFGIDMGTLIGGVIITEQVFTLHGLGYITVQAITTKDLPVIIGVVMLSSAFVVVANIVVDMVYAMLDPRVRLT